jgi:ubiquinone/menaquinone biosynthesis C-methylase UbiE
MQANAAFQPTDAEVERLDPYVFMAVIGKRVIHPGGRHSTEEMFRFADFKTGQRVLDVGCGVGTTAIEIATRFGCHVAAVDIAPLMLSRAHANVRAAGREDQVTIEKGDIQSLQFSDASFDRVIIEAVTMFVDRPRAACEVIRVCRPGGRVLDHEFIYRKPPPPEVRRIFEGEVCPGVRCDTAEEWIELYQTARLTNIQHLTGSFAMMTPREMIRDEGIGNVLAMMGRVVSRKAYLRKMGWLMSRMVRVMPYLGYVVLTGTKPAL